MTVEIPGNEYPTDGTVRFNVSINDGNDFIAGGSINDTQFYNTVEITIEEDDGIIS